MECLKRAVQYEHNPAVRVEAVEALQDCAGDEAGPWIRSALTDDHPAVRFAACVAVGRLADATAESAVRERLDDENASVRVAALFALHRMGHTDQTGFMPVYLLEHDDPTVRRNAAVVLGLMDEPGVIKMLARAMKDSDPGVRNYALEAMARLGNPEAKQELVFMTSAGIGSDEVFAIGALAQTGDRAYLDTFRYKLATASHIETRLAAARGLGVSGSDEGLDVALRALRSHRTILDDPKDPPEDQKLRVRQLAAAALGAIGRVEALPVLVELMDDPTDPRVQVCAAQAVVMIIKVKDVHAFPFGAPVSNRFHTEKRRR
jgi:HEAT repeat protein